MEVKDRNHTGFLMTLQHMWRIFRGYEEANEECPVATVIGHHPAIKWAPAMAARSRSASTKLSVAICRSRYA